MNKLCRYMDLRELSCFLEKGEVNGQDYKGFWDLSKNQSRRYCFFPEKQKIQKNRETKEVSVFELGQVLFNTGSKDSLLVIFNVKKDMESSFVEDFRNYTDCWFNTVDEGEEISVKEFYVENLYSKEHLEIASIYNFDEFSEISRVLENKEDFDVTKQFLQ